MKRLVLVGAMALSIVACSSTGTKTASGTDNFYTQQVESQHERELKAVERTVEKAPEWMTKVPRSAGAVYATGTATSDDYEMAVNKAKMFAYGKICMAAGGSVDQRSNVYRSDAGDTSTGSAELAIRATCAKVDITGVDPADKKVIALGNRYRAYVLLALPVGEANQLKKSKIEAEMQRNAVQRSREVFKEMDAPAEVRPISRVESINLIDVDNAEYKKKREEALSKPGAVVGHTTVQ